MSSSRPRLLTGDRPTGKMHLGHYVGSLRERVKRQQSHECFIIVADLHVLTTKNSPEAIFETMDNTHEMVLDQLACGIEPGQVTFYLQSALPEIYEIYTLLQSLVTVPRLQRTPSLKDMLQSGNLGEMPFALLGYPVLQSADILCGSAVCVPVGKDNLAHIEITREIAARFNHLYGNTLTLPEPLITDSPALVGIDGKAKMSKSLGNAIYLSEDPSSLTKKVRQIFTDPNRLSADTPGRVEGNPVFIYHDLFNDDVAQVNALKERYLKGQVGDSEVKQCLYQALLRFLEPIWERRAHFEKDKGLVETLLYEGTLAMQKEARTTLQAMKKAMGLSTSWNRVRRNAEKRSKQLDKDSPKE